MPASANSFFVTNSAASVNLGRDNSVLPDIEIDKFVAALSETPGLWQSVDLRGVAVWINSDWHCVVLRCKLDARPANSIPRLAGLPNTPLLGCWQEVRPIASLDAILSDVREGIIPISGVNIVARQFDNTGQPTATAFQHAYTSVASNVDQRSLGVERQSAVMHKLSLTPSTSNGSVFRTAGVDLNAIQRQLRSLSLPWESVSGLVRIALRSLVDPDHDSAPEIEIVAPLGLSLDKDALRCDDGRLHLTAWADTLAASRQCTIGYVAECSDGEYQNGTLDLRNRRWVGRPERRIEATLILPKTTRSVTLLLRLGRHMVESRVVDNRSARSGNPHLAIFYVTDPRLQRLRKILETSDQDSKRDGRAALLFERAVAQVFALAGFHSNTISATDSVDVIARTPDGDNVLAIECTLGALRTSDGKPDRLLARSVQLRTSDDLADATITPIMVSSRRRSEIGRGDLGQVGLDGIVVLCQEDLQDLVTRIEAGASPADVLRFCAQRVPSRSADRTGGSRLAWPP